MREGETPNQFRSPSIRECMCLWGLMSLFRLSIKGVMIHTHAVALLVCACVFSVCVDVCAFVCVYVCMVLPMQTGYREEIHGIMVQNGNSR